MATTTQAPPTIAPQKPLTNYAPPAPVSTTGSDAAVPKHKHRKLEAWLLIIALLILAVGAGVAWAQYSGIDVRSTVTAAWHKLTSSDMPDGFAFTNGRVEATKVYTTTKYQGRIETVLVREGDTIEEGQVLARIDTRTLQAQLRQAEAQIQRAKNTKAVAIATVAQREAELEFYKSDAERERRLIGTAATSQESYEAAYAKWKSGEATLIAAKSLVVETQASIDAAMAEADRIRVEIDESTLVAPRRGRVQYRLAEAGEVLAAGGRVLDSVDLTDVYMLFYLPEAEAGKVTIGAEARLLFDALPDAVIPASVYYVAPEAQFTPKTVETRAERQKLAFQVRARIDAALLKKYEQYVKIGLPGVVYVRLDPAVQWPERLQVRLPALPETKWLSQTPLPANAGSTLGSVSKFCQVIEFLPVFIHLHPGSLDAMVKS
jgi:HlyD family secretion protein